MHNTTAGSLTALAMGAGLLLSGGPAYAQAPTLPDCEGVLGVSYPPGLGGGATASDATPPSGSTITATSGDGVFDPGSAVLATFLTGPVDLGSVTADGDGEARLTFEVPASVEPGLHVLQFSGSRDGQERVVGVCLNVEGPQVLGAVAKPAPGAVAPRATPRSLPFTGSADLLTVSLVAAGLLAAGTATVVVARRRKDSTA